MKPFSQGKKTLAVESLRPPAQFSSALSSPHEHARAGAPGSHAGGASAHVEVIKEGDKIVRLVVTCVCGEKVEIECLYSAGR